MYSSNSPGHVHAWHRAPELLLLLLLLLSTHQHSRREVASAPRPCLLLASIATCCSIANWAALEVHEGHQLDVARTGASCCCPISCCSRGRDVQHTCRANTGQGQVLRPVTSSCSCTHATATAKRSCRPSLQAKLPSWDECATYVCHRGVISAGVIQLFPCSELFPAPDSTTASFRRMQPAEVLHTSTLRLLAP